MYKSHVTSAKQFSHRFFDVTQKIFVSKSWKFCVTLCYTKFIMRAGIMISARIKLYPINPMKSADSSGLSVIRSYLIQIHPDLD